MFGSIAKIEQHHRLIHTDRLSAFVILVQDLSVNSKMMARWWVPLLDEHRVGDSYRLSLNENRDAIKTFAWFLHQLLLIKRTIVQRFLSQFVIGSALSWAQDQAVFGNKSNCLERLLANSIISQINGIVNFMAKDNSAIRCWWAARSQVPRCR